VCDAAGDTLCDTCNDIKLQDFFLDRPDRHGYPPSKDTSTTPLEKRLGFLDDIIQESDCALCHLVVRALEQSWTEMSTLFNTGLGLFGLGQARTEVVLQSCEATTSETPVRPIKIYVTCEGTRVLRAAPGGAELKFQPEWRLLADDAPVLSLKKLRHRRRILSVCDAEPMAIWYRKCKMSHPETCATFRIAREDPPETQEGDGGPKPELPPNTRLIDVQKMQLVPGERAGEFVALCYVWGKCENNKLNTTTRNLKKRQLTGGLIRVRCPKTIADAINLAKDLDIQLLWIDALCIVQDGDDKENQIQTMHRIYGLLPWPSWLLQALTRRPV
jgi:hypothetical protein